MKLKNILPVLLMFIFLLGKSSCVVAQKGGPTTKAQENFQLALQSYAFHNYEKAENLSQKAISQSPTWAEPYYLLGDIYIATKQSDKEIAIYNKLLETDQKHFTAYMRLGEAYSKLGKLQEAADNFKMLQMFDNAPERQKELANKRLKEITFAQQMMKKPVPFDPKNLGPEINSKSEEYFPTFTVDGETMYFTRLKVQDSMKAPGGASGYIKRFNEDILISKKVNNAWQPAKDVTDINTNENEGAMAISPDGSFMIFTACQREDGLGSCDLYISFLVDGKWTRAVNMGEPVNSRSYETQATISYDGRTIYFASNRPGTIGGLDIWKSTRDDNWNFGKPENLGPVINTKEDDQKPFIHPDNQTMYFCSRGHLGMGMNDIFVARKDAPGKWNSVKNIGYPINTTEDEPGLIVDRKGEYAYMSSSNKNSLGGLDIFYFRLPKEAQPNAVTYLKGKVFDAYSKKPIASTFELIDLESGETVNKSSTGKDGQFLITLPGAKNYMLNVSAKGYLFYSQHLPLKDYNKTAPYEQDIALHPIKVGEKITLNNIFFATNSFELEERSKNELNKLVSFLKENSTIKIEISGHTDNVGKAESNATLSQNRAKAVHDYLLKEGISPGRLIWKGYGQTQPIAKNDTEEGRAQNRRTEVKVISQ